MLRVSAFTAGARTPAARFRVRQYIAPLADLGVAMTERYPSLGGYPPRCGALRPPWLVGTLAQRIPEIMGSWRDHAVLLQREMVSTLPTLEGLTRRPRVVDVDDAIHLFRGGCVARYLARLADLVVVGNAWLAEVWRRLAGEVEILPTGVDTGRYGVDPLPEAPVLGWIGSSGNLVYLERIAPALEAVVRRHPDTTIAVCCDRRPRLDGLPVRFVPWSEAAEPGFLSSLSIGLSPLDEGPWERGKCSFKMLQYMAAGRPCVVSPVGMNCDILGKGEIGRGASTEAEWIEALSGLIADRRSACEMGAAGRALAVRAYSVAALAPQLADLLRRVC